MTQQTICELAILFLIALASFRIFLIKDPSSDPLASLPTLALIMSVLNIIVYGPTFQNIVVFAVTLFVFFANFRALLRLNENLIVDHYSAIFIVTCCFSLLLILATGAFVIFFSPIVPNLKKYEVTKTSQVYSGNLETGFFVSDNPFNKKTAYVYHYEQNAKSETSESENKTTEKPTIIFIPNERATSFIYEPILVKLAHDGYDVYSADFYFRPDKKNKRLSSKFVKRASFLNDSFKAQEKYKQWQADVKSSYDAYLYKSLISIVSPQEKDFVILLGDCTDEQMFLNIKKDEERIDICLDLSIIDGYDTKGYGPVEQTDPFIATILGKKKDPGMYVSNHTANLLEQLIKQSMLIAGN